MDKRESKIEKDYIYDRRRISLKIFHYLILLDFNTKTNSLYNNY